MARKRLIWQIYPPFLLILMIALLAFTWVFSSSLDTFHDQETKRDLEARVRLIIPQVMGSLQASQSAYLDALSKNLGEQTNTRITIILPDGQVVGDSKEDPRRMDNHADRPEVIDALQGKLGVATRFSHTLQQRMMYVALPVSEDDQVLGCVRAALPVKTMTRTLESAFYPVINSGLMIALIATLLSLWLSRRISRPLEEMKRGAERFARGELDGRLPSYSGEEMGGLAEAMNQMAAQLDDRIRTVVRQRNEQEAVLSSMIEGVIAVDKEERILSINQTAAHLLDVDPADAVGRRIQEKIRKPELQKFISEALQSQSAIEADLSLLIRGSKLFLQAHGTLLLDSRGKDFGALVVLNDITRLQRLENIRRDFVANVSHELKTPITAIKGSVETLLGGAMEETEDANRFLEIISRQAERLNAIIEDLLSLSRLERDAEANEISCTNQALQPILESALQACSALAASKQVQVNLFCSEELRAKVNAPLLEQAIINLLDNAIKYSDNGEVVTVEGWQDREQVKIKVQDRGQGIAKEHLPRLFERFYRIDAARSRAVGGTGLGLAIVKHIIQAHDGEVTVHSTPGEGSVFTITLQTI